MVGSFILPNQTQWGSAVLASGDYTCALDHARLNGRILIMRANKGAALVLAQGMNATSHSGSSSMLIVGNRVRSLHLAAVGQTYIYQTHRQKREMLAMQSSVPGVSVAV